jgi:hypothetical protein
MSREEIVARLATLQKQYPQAFIEGEFREVKDVERSRGELLEFTQEESAEEVSRHAN